MPHLHNHSVVAAALAPVLQVAGIGDAYHWGQPAKFFLKLLQVWQDGVLMDGVGPGSSGSGGIKCNKTIFLCTMNAADEAIAQFAKTNRAVLHEKLQAGDVQWIRDHLCDKVMGKAIVSFLKRIDKKVLPLYRRIDVKVPFLPFTEHEQRVFADTVLRSWCTALAATPDPKGGEQLIGRMRVRFTERVVERVKQKYDELTGASAFEQETRTILADATDYVMQRHGDLGADLHKDPVTKKEYFGGAPPRKTYGEGGPLPGTKDQLAGPVWIGLSPNGTVEMSQEKPAEDDFGAGESKLPHAGQGADVAAAHEAGEQAHQSDGKSSGWTWPSVPAKAQGVPPSPP